MSDNYNFNQIAENFAKQVREALRPILSAKQEFTSIAEDFKRAATNFEFTNPSVSLSITLNRIKQGILKTEEDMKVFKIAIIELGYPPHEGMDISTIRGIAQAYTNDKEHLSEIIDQIMCDYYDDDFIMMISGLWEENDTIKERLPILRNVIMAHNQGMYNVAIPSILAQFEGSLVDAFNIRGKVDGTIVNKLIRILLKNNSSDTLWSFDKEIHKFYEENLMVSFNHGGLIGSKVSRHAILHGGDKEYGTQENSIKLILLFDYIATEFKNIDDKTIKKANEEISKYRKYNKTKFKKKR